MREGWTKRDYSIPIPYEIKDGKVTETRRRTDHGYVNGPFAIRLHCTTTFYAKDAKDGGIHEYACVSKRKPTWEITHIPTGALLPPEFKTLKRSQEFCEAMLERGTWRFRKVTSAQVPAFREAMRHAERAVENRHAEPPPDRTDRRSATAGDSRGRGVKQNQRPPTNERP